MTQRKPPELHHPRRGSEQRQRQHFVGVRFNRDEFSVLSLAAGRRGKSMSSLLREAFLRDEARLSPATEAEIRAGERRKLAAELERRATAIASHQPPTAYSFEAAAIYREAAHVVRERADG